MAYLGNTPTQQGFTPAIDYFSGNASTTAFTLSRPVASVAQVQAVIENVPQNPGDAFTVSGNTITFTSAPPSGTNNIYVYYTSPITTVVQPGQGTVFPSSLSTGGLYWSATGNVGIGETNPTQKLEVVGTTRVKSAAADSNGLNLSSDVNGVGYINAGYSVGNLVFQTNNTERMRIDSSGRVTMPYQPAFMAQGNTSGFWSVGSDSVWYIPTNSTGAAAQTVSGTNAGFNMTASGGARFNIGSHYNPATGRFTAPVAGKYFFFTSGLWQRNSTTSTHYQQIQIFINGTGNYLGWDQQPYLYTGSSGLEMVLSFSTFLDLAANDVVDVRINKAGTISTFSDRFYFGGHLVC